MNPSHKDSQLMRNSDTASDQWSMSGLTTHCPSQARAKTDNSDGKMTQKLSQTVQIKTDSKIVLIFPYLCFLTIITLLNCRPDAAVQREEQAPGNNFKPEDSPLGGK